MHKNSGKSDRLQTGKDREKNSKSVLRDRGELFFEHCFGGVNSDTVKEFAKFHANLQMREQRRGMHVLFGATHAPQPVLVTEKFALYRLHECDLRMVEVSSAKDSRATSTMANPRVRMLFDVDEGGHYGLVPYSDERWCDVTKPVCTERQVCQLYDSVTGQPITAVKGGEVVIGVVHDMVEVSAGHYRVKFDGGVQTRRLVTAMFPESQASRIYYHNLTVAAHCHPVLDMPYGSGSASCTMDEDGCDGQAIADVVVGDDVLSEVSDPKRQVYVPVPAPTPDGCVIKRSSLMGMVPTVANANTLPGILETVHGAKSHGSGFVVFAMSEADMQIDGHQVEHITVQKDGATVHLVPGDDVAVTADFASALANKSVRAFQVDANPDPLLLVPHAARLASDQHLYHLSSFDGAAWCRLAVHPGFGATRKLDIDTFERLVAVGQRNPCFPHPMGEQPDVAVALDRMGYELPSVESRDAFSAFVGDLDRITT